MAVSRTDWRGSDHRRREAALAVSARSGDRGAWAELYNLLAPELYRRVLMPRLGHRAAAEDALSETFRTAIEQIDRFEDQGHGLYPWLCRIAHNKAMDLHRARAQSSRKLIDLSHVLETLQSAVQGADELYELHLEEGELGARLRTALGELSPRYRRALELRFFEERSREACAEALEVRLGTFDVLVLRALRALRKYFHGVQNED